MASLFNHSFDTRIREQTQGERINTYHVAHGPRAYGYALHSHDAIRRMLAFIDGVDMADTITVDVYEVTFQLSWDFDHDTFVVERDGQPWHPNADTGCFDTTIAENEYTDCDGIVSTDTYHIDGDIAAKMVETHGRMRDLMMEATVYTSS